MDSHPENHQHVKRFYNEFVRFYAGPALLSKYLAEELMTIKGPTNNQFDAETLFEFPVRRMRISNDFGDNPIAFNEGRYLDETIANPLLAPYSPFGFSNRACPGSNSLTPDI